MIDVIVLKIVERCFLTLLFVGVYPRSIEKCVCCLGTGNVADDMQNQIKANSLRISVLETENAKLRTTVGKMLNVATGGSGSDVTDRLAAAMKVKTPPVQLWKFDSPDRLVLATFIPPFNSREIFSSCVRTVQVHIKYIYFMCSLANAHVEQNMSNV